MLAPASPARRFALVMALAAAVAAVLWLSDLALRAAGPGPSHRPAAAVTESRDPCATGIDQLELPAEVDRAGLASRADPLLIASKRERRLYLLAGGEITGCWVMSFGPEPGAKQVEGDRRTPEGWYRTSDKPESNYAGAIAIHYPNVDDADRALAAGRIDAETHRTIVESLADGQRPPQHTPMGGDILIHGRGELYTLGCLSLTDDDLTDLRHRLPPDMATDILIAP